jgi:hypothetical protein
MKGLKTTIQRSLDNSIDILKYNQMMVDHAANHSTTGPQQTESLIHYTKLNAQRMKRIFKTLNLDPQTKQIIGQIDQPQSWLIITEGWCGDAASNVPVLAKMALLNPNIDLKLVLRDEHLELMDQFLTNGGRSIPKLIALDQNLEVLFTWGPRPLAAQHLYDQWKAMDPRPPYNEISFTLQKWYHQNKGAAVQEEVRSLLQHHRLPALSS